MLKGKRAGRPLTVAVLLTLLVVAIGGGLFYAPPKAASATTLTFLRPKFDEGGAFIKVANEAGKGMGVEGKPHYPDWEGVFQKALLDYKSGVKTWDLIYAYNTWIPAIAETKAFTPLDEFLAKPENKAMVKPEDFIKETTQGFIANGKLWAFPVLSAPYMMAYRTDLL